MLSFLVAASAVEAFRPLRKCLYTQGKQTITAPYTGTFSLRYRREIEHEKAEVLLMDTEQMAKHCLTHTL